MALYFLPPHSSNQVTPTLGSVHAHLQQPLPRPGWGHPKFTGGACAREGSGSLLILQESLWARSQVGKVTCRLETTEKLSEICPAVALKVAEDWEELK